MYSLLRINDVYKDIDTGNKTIHKVHFISWYTLFELSVAINLQLIPSFTKYTHNSLRIIHKSLTRIYYDIHRAPGAHRESDEPDRMHTERSLLSNKLEVFSLINASLDTIKGYYLI